MILMNLNDVYDLLEEYGELIPLWSRKKAPFVKPGHGSCCTCQTCGYCHDECVCMHNDLMDKINNMKKCEFLTYVGTDNE